jgi:hypothetical protein
MIELNSIYNDLLQPLGSELFRELGYAPLEDYHAAGGEQFLRQYALKVLHDVVVELERDALLHPFVNEKKGEDGNSVLIFGHAVYSNAVAAQAALMLGHMENGRQHCVAMGTHRKLDIAHGIRQPESACLRRCAELNFGETDVILVGENGVQHIESDAAATPWV